MDQFHELAKSRSRDADLGGEVDHNADLCIDLRGSAMHGKVTPHAGVSLCRLTVERGQVGDAGSRGGDTRRR